MTPFLRRAARAIILAFFAMAALPASAAGALTAFADRNGCKVLGSSDSVARLREIASQGSVTWEGRCREGFIDGPGGLLHQGTVVENGRTRRYAFLLTGSAQAGRRIGSWRRETFNMFEDSNRYWTSLATIVYVDGVSRGSPKLLPVRSNDDFTASFQRYLAGIDRELAARKPATEAREPAPASTAAGPPTPAGRPETTGAASAAAAPQLAGAPPTAPVRSAPDAASQSPAARSFQGSGLRVENDSPPPRLGSLAPPPARTAPAQPGPQVLEQTGACYLDQINERVIGAEPVVAPAAQPLRISGWAADPRQPAIPEKAWLRLYDRGGGPGLLLDLPRNVDRPDVAKALGDPVYARAGFAMTIAPGRLSPGEYTVAIVQQLGAELAVCTVTARLSLR